MGEYEVDEYSQEYPDYDGAGGALSDLAGAKKGWAGRGSKGNRAEQARRYRVRNRSRLNEYMRAYMAERRKALKAG